MKNAFHYTHKGPIINWHEGLMLGTGHIGALIYGKDNLIVSLDMIDLWDNRLTSEMKEIGFNYQNMVKTMKEDWNEYLRLFDNCYNHPYPTKINAGSIILDYPIEKHTIFDIDIKKAECSINEIRGYVDANKDVLVLCLPNHIDFHFHMPEYLYREENGLGYPPYVEKDEGEYRYLIQETKCGYSYSIVTLRKNGLLLVTIIKSGDVDKAKELLKNYSENLEVEHQKHLDYWKKFYNHSSIKTHIYEIDSAFNFGRYFLACNSRNKYPMSLEGVWTRNDGNLPPWKGDYHLDINLQMSYESYMKTGDFKEGKVLVDYLWNHRNKFKANAKKFCECNGYFIPGVMTQDGDPLGGWPMYALNPCNFIWICTAFDNYYRYKGDQAFLKNRAFPFIREVEKCLSHLMVKDVNGHLMFEFSASPEINDNEKSSILSQSNFEISLLKFLYRVLIDYSKALGLDSSEYEKKYSMISDYKRNANGELKISEELEYQTSHRHFSHILCHKNLENFSPYCDKEQIIKDYNRLIKYGTSQWVGFSFTEASSLAGYIGLGEDAYKHLYAFVDGFNNGNHFHMNMDYKHKGYSEIESYAFTLEANMGMVKALSDMMLRTTDGIITIFPAIPQLFKQKGVIFKKLRAYNNHKVSGQYKNEVLDFSIKLSRPDTIKLYNNIANKFVLEIDGQEKVIDSKLDEIINIPATKSIVFKSVLK